MVRRFCRANGRDMRPNRSFHSYGIIVHLRFRDQHDRPHQPVGADCVCPLSWAGAMDWLAGNSLGQRDSTSHLVGERCRFRPLPGLRFPCSMGGCIRFPGNQCPGSVRQSPLKGLKGGRFHGPQNPKRRAVDAYPAPSADAVVHGHQSENVGAIGK